MESKLITRLTLLAFLIFICFIVFFPSLGTVSFWESDEARYAICARNAIEHKKWIVLEYNGHPRVEKPPLMTWLVAISSILLNHGKVNEFTSRIPSLLAAVGVVIIVFLLAEKLFESSFAALISGFSLTTSYLFYKHARFSITDMVLTFFVTLGLFAFYLFSLSPEKKRFLLLMYFAFAMATMDKGPAVGVALPFFIMLFYIASLSKWELLKKMIYAPGIALFLFIVLPWPLLMGSKYLKIFLWKSNIKRFASNPSWKTPFYFYLVNFPLEFSPWSAFLPLFFLVLKKRARESQEMGILFPIVWFTVTFVLFSLSDTKRPSYILPLYPAAALLTGWAIVKALYLKDELKNPWRISLFLFCLSLVGYAVGFVISMARHVPSYLPTATASLALAFVIAAFIFLLAKWGTYKEALLLSSASALVIAIGYTAYFQPVYDENYRSARPYCLDIRQRIKNAPLYHLGSIRAHDIFYIGLREIPSFRKSFCKKGVYVMTKLKNWKKIKPSLRDKFEVIKEYKFRDTKIFLLKVK